jgi:pheromone a factor receptor
MYHGITNMLFVLCAGIGALLVAIPFPRAIASGNVGTSMLIVWIEAAFLVQFVNAIRWHQNIENWAPVWCDFCGYFLPTADVALVACGVSINRRLYMIATLDPRRHEKGFNTVVDIILCLVIPSASIVLQYVVHQYRFYILEDIGCLPGIGTVNLAFPLVWMIPVLVGTVLAGYACLTIRANLRRNHGLMGKAGGSLAWSRRLMAIGVVSSMYGLIPTSIVIALLATAYPVTPWPGWRAIHSTIDVIVYVPVEEWRSNSTQIASVELRRWTTVTLAFTVFVFLGLTADMKKMYLSPFRSVIEQTASFGQTSIKTVPEKNADVDGQKAPQWSRSFDNPHAGRRQEGLGLTNRPRLDSDLGGFQLVFPVSQSPAVTHPSYPPRKLRHEGDGYPAYYI